MASRTAAKKTPSKASITTGARKRSPRSVESPVELDADWGSAGNGPSAYNPERRRGWQLTDAIRARQQVLVLTQADVAERFGVSPNHLSALLSGTRWWGTMDAAKLEIVAQFLNASKASVYLYAEILTPNDFVVPDEVERMLEQVGQAILSDNRMPSIVPNMEAWNSLPRWARLAMGYLYQEFSQDQIIKLGELDLHAPDSLQGS